MTKESETETPTKTRLTEAQWLVASTLWERGEVTLRDLSEKFGTSEAALSQGFKRRGIIRGSKAHAAYKEIESKVRAEKEKLIEEIFEFKKRYVKYGDFLARLALTELETAKTKDELDKLTTRAKMETIYSATKVYTKIRNDLFHLYDLYNPDNKPTDDLEFNIGIYDEKELEKLREAQELMAKEFSKDEKEEGVGFPSFEIDEEE